MELDGAEQSNQRRGRREKWNDWAVKRNGQWIIKNPLHLTVPLPLIDHSNWSSTIKLFICHWLKWITKPKMKEADKRNKTVLGSKKTTKLNWGEDIWTNLFARLISEDDFDFFAVDPRLHGQHGLVDEAGQPLCPHWAGMMESYEGQTVNIGRLGAGVELQSTEVVIALII